MYILLCQKSVLTIISSQNEHFKASADDVIPSTKSVCILKSLVGVKMPTRQQRLEAEADASTNEGDLDLRRLFNSGFLRSGSASTMSCGVEEGDLRLKLVAKEDAKLDDCWRIANSRPTPLIVRHFLH